MEGKTWEWTGTDVIPLTRDAAEEIASLPHFEGDRPWDSTEGRRRMNWLEDRVIDGRFFPPRWATAELDGKVYRVNGGTSSHMLVGLNGEFPNGLVALVDRFRCKSMHDVADLFDQFDHRKSSRTLTQKVRAHKPAEDVLRDVSPTDIHNAVVGIAAVNENFGPLDEDERLKLIHRYPEYIAWAAPFMRRRFLKGRGVSAAIFASYRTDAIYAKGFWGECSEESNPNFKHPTRVLAKFLRDHYGAKPEKRFPARVVYTKCVHAWNAARSGGTTALKVYKSTDLPQLV